MTRTPLIAIAAAALAVTPAALADGGGGSHGGSDRTTAFTGSCRFSGPVAFQPALTNSPQSVHQRVRAPGTCAGAFVDPYGRSHELDDAPVTYFASAEGDASCAAGSPTGSGMLLFRWGKLQFSLSEKRATSVVAISLTGARTGSATGLATASPSESPVTAVQRCAGSGISQSKIDIQLITTLAIAG